jgi:hypothetical protein
VYETKIKIRIFMFLSSLKIYATQALLPTEKSGEMISFIVSTQFWWVNITYFLYALIYLIQWIIKQHLLGRRRTIWKPEPTGAFWLMQITWGWNMTLPEQNPSGSFWSAEHNHLHFGSYYQTLEEKNTAEEEVGIAWKLLINGGFAAISNTNQDYWAPSLSWAPC